MTSLPFVTLALLLVLALQKKAAARANQQVGIVSVLLGRLEEMPASRTPRILAGTTKVHGWAGLFHSFPPAVVLFGAYFGSAVLEGQHQMCR